jgi:hypothetical protein
MRFNSRRSKTARKAKKSRKMRRMRLKKQYGGTCVDIKGKPDGFYLFCDAISEAEESAIIKNILEEGTEYYKQTNVGFGTRAFKLVTDSMPTYLVGSSIEALFSKPVSELSGKIKTVREHIDRLGEGKFNANHFLVNRYEGGVGIYPHRNSIDFGPLVIGVSLGDSCEFILSPRAGTDGETYKYIVPPRSIYIMSGDSRYRYNHEIPPLSDGTKRISITIRDSAPKETRGAGAGAGEGAVAAAAPSIAAPPNIWNKINNIEPSKKAGNAGNNDDLDW